MRLQDLEGIPWSVQTLLGGRSVLHDSQVLEGLAEMAPLRMMLSLQGGKGGFGALLRSTKAKAGQKKMDNNSACRDLNGRRLRHVQAEKKILEWKPTPVKHRDLQAKYAKIRQGTDRRRKDQFEVDTDETSQRFIVTFHYNKELLNKFKAAIPQEDRTFVKFSQQWLVMLKAAPLLGQFITQNEWTFSEQARLWIWGASGPESISRNRQQFKLRNLGRGFSQIATNGDAIESEMRDSVQSGLSLKRKQAAKARVEAAKKLKVVPEADEDAESEAEEDADADPFAEFIQLKAPFSRTAAVTVLEPQPFVSSLSSSSISSSQAQNTNIEIHNVSSSNDAKTSVNGSNNTETKVSECSNDSTTETNATVSSPTVPPVPAPPVVPKEWPPIHLSQYSSASELESCGLEHLKTELKRLGLKCGGSLSQRAERLFLLATISFEKLDKKHKA